MCFNPWCLVMGSRMGMGMGMGMGMILGMGSWNVSFFNGEGCGASKKQISKKISIIFEPLYLDNKR